MRLLRTTPSYSNENIVYRVKEIPNRNLTSYAILSHRWEDQEITFHDLLNKIELLPSQKPCGYRKLQESCRIAKENGFEYIWNDTCCISKENSAEVSEELNSMFFYYANSVVCYVYLNDVLADPSDPGSFLTCFKKSEWFSRGWTLQELLAPSSMIFFDKDWNRIGTKASLSRSISEATRIPVEVLLGHVSIATFSIAQRMSWAARRLTTKPEDIAYCLMGIFSVHMPVLYGEGKTRAFLRLQEEIIKHNDDPTIFVWTAYSSDVTDLRRCRRGLLAWSPSEFASSYDIQPFFHKTRTSHSMTNRGISITLFSRSRSSGEALKPMVPAFYIMGTLTGSLILLVMNGGKIESPGQLLCIFIAILLILPSVLMTVIVYRPPWDKARVLNILMFFWLGAGLIAAGPGRDIGYWVITCGANVIVLNIYSIYLDLRSFSDRIIRARLPCSNGNNQVIEILLQKNKDDTDWIRISPQQLEYCKRERKSDIFGYLCYLFLYRKHTIYVKEEFLAGKQLQVVDRPTRFSWNIDIINKVRVHKAESFPRSESTKFKCQTCLEVIEFTLGSVQDNFDTTSSLNLALTQAKTKFAVAFGVSNNGHIWVDIVTPENRRAQESLEEIYVSYNDSSNRRDVAQARCLDEVSASLGDGLIYVKIIYLPWNQGHSSDITSPRSGRRFRVDIDFVPSESTSQIPRALVQPLPTLCGLRIIFRLTSDAKDLLIPESIPIKLLNDEWTAGTIIGYLAFNSKETSGKVIFGRRQDVEKLFYVQFNHSGDEPTAEIGDCSTRRWGFRSNKSQMAQGTGQRSVTIEEFDVMVDFAKPEAGGVGMITDIAVITISIRGRIASGISSNAIVLDDLA